MAGMLNVLLAAIPTYDWGISASFTQAQPYRMSITPCYDGRSLLRIKNPEPLVVWPHRILALCQKVCE